MPRATVVIPARDAATTLPDCLRAVGAQSLPRDEYEVIVVVDGRSRDGTRAIADAHPCTVVVQRDHGIGGARNLGIRAASTDFVAFTDADCIPTRGWLQALLGGVGGASTGHRPATTEPEGDGPVLGVAGPTVGYRSDTPAARFVDLTGGLQAERHLAHPRYPWAPTTNVLYRREALLAVGGFDPRFASYEGCDLHTRLRRGVGGEFRFEPRAVVYHRHRAGWRAYWRQQRNYGRGYAQFFRRYADELPWTVGDEARAWLRLGATGLSVLVPGPSDGRLLARGRFLKDLAQRIGFTTTYWSPREQVRWRAAVAADGSA